MPIIGWMWYFTEMVFCTRKWEQDRKTVSQSLLRLRDYPEKYFVRKAQSDVPHPHPPAPVRSAPTPGASRLPANLPRAPCLHPSHWTSQCGSEPSGSLVPCRRTLRELFSCVHTCTHTLSLYFLSLRW